MARIMCTTRLLRALDAGRPRRIRKEPLFPNTRLGTWALGMTDPEDGELVVALNLATCLTLVFPVARGGMFRQSFAMTLTETLEGMNVPRGVALTEAAVVEHAPVTGMSGGEHTRTLRDLEFVCGLELRYQPDLRRVRDNLHEWPFFRRHPRAAVEELFALAARRSHTD